MNQPANTPTCIYCNQHRPFTDEHIFPAGLGGDDNRYLLTDLVCGHCNTEVFSKFETAFMRNSPAALGRIFMQPFGRGKGKNASVPSLETKSATVFEPNVGLFLEVELQAGGQAVVLPQVVFSDAGVAIGGGDETKLHQFLAKLQDLTSTNSTLIEKGDRCKALRFQLTPISWNSMECVLGEVSFSPKPPQHGLWIAELELTSNQDNIMPLPRLFQRSAGQLVLRVNDHADIRDLLTRLRTTVQEENEVCFKSGATIEAPDLALGFSMDMNVYPRLLAKIGVNLATHVLGESTIRNSGFDEVKKAILLGSPNVRLLPPEVVEEIPLIFNSVPTNLHVMMLVEAPIPTVSGRSSHLLFYIRLYGGPIHAIQLTTDGIIPPKATLPTFFTVDFNKHEVNQFDPLGFVQAFPPTY